MGDMTASGDGCLADSVAETVALSPGDLLAAGSGDRGHEFAGQVVDVELIVDVDVDQGVPVGEADAQPVSGDLG
jgi:hypothetical protein